MDYDGIKVLVCGSRGWDRGAAIRTRLGELPPGSSIIHGAARGADQLAASHAQALGIPERGFPAKWQAYGKQAGFLRNIEMLDEGPDLVIAFWDGESRGTQFTITEARKRGIPVEIHR